MAIVSANGAATPLSPNYIINGAFDFWQRGTSFNAPAAVYTADRFIANNITGDVVSQQVFTPGSEPVQGYGSQYYLRSANSSTAGERYLYQKVEDVRTLAGQIATFSFWARVSTGTTSVGAYFYQMFGSGGSADNPTTLQSFTLTTSWQRFSYTALMPSVAGKTIGANSNFQAAIRYINTSSNLETWGWQVEIGSIATPFRRNAPSIQGELAACQRYFQRYYSPALRGVVGVSSTSTMNRGGMMLTVPLRATPLSVTFSGNINVYDGTNIGLLTSMPMNYSTSTVLEGDFAMNFTSVANRPLVVYQGNSGYIDLSAEL